MEPTQKRSAVPGVIFAVIILAIIGGIYAFSQNKEATPATEEMMTLELYVQDKEAAATSDCGVTQKISYQTPKTTAVADASLKILFQIELARYGTYDSVTITDGVAKVMLSSAMTSLSSCESMHLMSVLEDTLTQYETIKSVELYSPEGKIEF